MSIKVKYKTIFLKGGILACIKVNLLQTWAIKTKHRMEKIHTQDFQYIQ